MDKNKFSLTQKQTSASLLNNSNDNTLNASALSQIQKELKPNKILHSFNTGNLVFTNSHRAQNNKPLELPLSSGPGIPKQSRNSDKTVIKKVVQSHKQSMSDDFEIMKLEQQNESYRNQEQPKLSQTDLLPEQRKINNLVPHSRTLNDKVQSFNSHRGEERMGSSKGFDQRELRPGPRKSGSLKPEPSDPKQNRPALLVKKRGGSARQSKEKAVNDLSLK